MSENEQYEEYGNAPDHEDGEGTVYGAVTFGFDGHVENVEADVHVPPAADGSRPLHWESHAEGDHDAAAPDEFDLHLPHGSPSIPPVSETDINNADVPEGYHRDQFGLLAPGAADLPPVPDVHLTMPGYDPEITPPHLEVPELRYPGHE